MATFREIESKKKGKGFEIQIYANGQRFCARWFPQPTWSAKTVQRELNKFAADFQLKCESGEVQTRKDKKAAEAEAAEAESRIQTVKQFAEKVFIPTKRANVSKGTVYFYENALKNHILPRFGDMKLPTIKSADISAFLLEKQATGLSHSSMIAIYTTIDQVLHMAYMSDLIDRNPMDKVIKPRQAKEDKDKSVSYFTADELNHIYDCLKNEPIKWQAFVHIAGSTGCRKGEICGIKWSSVDFSNRTIMISENVCYNSNDGTYIGATKTGHSRIVYFDDETAVLLHKLKDEQIQVIQKRADRMQKEGKQLDFKKLALPEYLFTDKTDNTSPMHPQAPDRYFQKFSKKYGIEDFHPHKLRHTYASLALSAGATVTQVAKQLGHSKNSTTLDVYAEADLEEQRKGAEMLYQLLKQA